MKHEIDWSKSHNGVMLCTYDQTIQFMPEVTPILNELIPQLQFTIDDYLIDVKVHMLMPEEFPCIPNLHRDFVPRDEERNLRPDLITGEKMYLWISGAPFTEFINKGKVTPIEAQKWIEFSQNDWHRGVQSDIHTWRCFIRAIPKKFVHPNTLNVGTIRRHTQVYLDSKKFKW